MIDRAGFDKTRTGQIVGVNTLTNTYSVKVDNHVYANVRTVNDAAYNIHDLVKIVIPCNQATQMYITSSVLSDDSLGKKVGRAQALGEANSSDILSLYDLTDDLKEQIDGKIETWAQETNPATAWGTAELKQAHDDDLWLYTGLGDINLGYITIKPQRTYKYDASTEHWVAYSIGKNVFDLADGKSTVFYGKYATGTSSQYPSNPSGGDFFYNTTNSHLYRYVNSQWQIYESQVAVDDYLVDPETGSTYKYTGTNWEKVTDYQTPIAQIAQQIDELGNLWQLYIVTTYTSGNVIYTAVLMKNSVDVTNDTITISGQTEPKYANDMEWCAKNIDGIQFLGNGSTLTMAQTSMNYGKVLQLRWTMRDYENLFATGIISGASTTGQLLTTDGKLILARSEVDSLPEAS